MTLAFKGNPSTPHGLGRFCHEFPFSALNQGQYIRVRPPASSPTSLVSAWQAPPCHVRSTFATFQRPGRSKTALGSRPLETPQCLPRLFPSPVAPHRVPRLSRRRCERLAAPHHGPEKPPREVTLRQQEPVIACVLHQPSARLHQSLLQAGHRPVAHAHGSASRRHRLPRS